MDFNLLQKLLPHEMQQYVIEKLDVRCQANDNQNGGVVDASDEQAVMS